MTKKKKPLKVLSTGAVTNAELKAVIEEVQTSTDRAAAVQLGAFVESVLGECLLSLLWRPGSKASYEHKMAQTTFQEKNIAAFKLEIIDDRIFKNMEIIREVRNAFAHSARPISFQTPEVIAVVDEIEDDGKGLTPEMAAEMAKARAKYTSSCMVCVATVKFRAMGKKIDLMGRVTKALLPYTDPALAPHSEAISKAAEVLSKFTLK
jgi:hypothetical protein